VLSDTRKALSTGVLPPASRKPHLMLPLFTARVAARTATPFTLRAMAVVIALEAAIATLDPSGRFEAPRTIGASGECRPLSVSDWSSAAQKLAEDEVGLKPGTRTPKSQAPNHKPQPQTKKHKTQTTIHKSQTTHHKPQTTNNTPQPRNPRPQTLNNKPNPPIPTPDL
jgi:CD68 antigen